jgi:hypothetical protein
LMARRPAGPSGARPLPPGRPARVVPGPRPVRRPGTGARSWRGCCPGSCAARRPIPPPCGPETGLGFHKPAAASPGPRRRHPVSLASGGPTAAGPAGAGTRGTAPDPRVGLPREKSLPASWVKPLHGAPAIRPGAVPAPSA